MANQLHRHLAQRILTHTRTEGLQPGHHLTEAALQRLFGTSRAPIRAALAQLAGQGFVLYHPNRGYFLAAPGGAGEAAEPSGDHDEPSYLAIAADRLGGRLPESVSESELTRRYGVPRDRLRRILERASKEGWIERRAGRGWTFLPMIDSPRAYAESYELRQVLEPAGLLAPTFVADRAVLARLTAQQHFVHDEGHRTLGDAELFETNSGFHEALAMMSGNRFLAQTIVRQNQLRRLVEYRQNPDRTRVRRQSAEHLDILAHLAGDDRRSAAEAMLRHLRGACDEKLCAPVFTEAPAGNPGPGLQDGHGTG